MIQKLKTLNSCLLQIMNKKLFLLPCIAVVAIATVVGIKTFKSNADENGDSTIAGYDNGVLEQDSALPTFTDRIEVTALRRKDGEARLISPEKLIESNDCYYILDFNRVLQYDKEGNFKDFIGEKGNGHGEYISIASFVVRNDTVKLLDSFKNSLLAYSVDGSFLYEKEAPEGILHNLKNADYETGDVLFLSNYIFNEQNDVYVRWNTLTDEVSVVANAIVRTEETKESVGPHSFSVFDGSVRYLLPFSNILYNTQGDALQFSTSQKVLGESELKEIHDFSIMSYMTHQDCFSGFNSIFETENYILLSFFNLEYTVVDKRTNECCRFNYQTDDDYLPLFNILASSKDAFLGIANLEDNPNLKNKVKEYLHESDAAYENVLIKYFTKI